jgi:cell wall-associated NlpC family hydrolase
MLTFRGLLTTFPFPPGQRITTVAKVVDVTRDPGESRVWARRIGAVVLFGALVLAVAAPPAEADGSSGTSSGAATAVGGGSDITTQLNAAQAQAKAVEGQLAAEELQVSQASEQYDQASVALATTQSELAQTAAQLADAQQREAASHRQLQADAVNAYIYDVPAEGLDTLFSPASETTALHNQYQAAAIGNVRQAVQDLETSQHQLAATQATERTQAQQAVTQAQAAAQAEQAARAASATAQATLDGLNGKIAQLVAQQAAEQAAAAAAAAKAAADAAAKQQAAAAAAAAAQVAQTVDSGSAAASAATDAANQAALLAGTDVTLGTGKPETATGAGAVALHTAEKYLSVPYVWGGASTSGVDCSGLTMLAWQAAGVSLVHSAALQFLQSTPVPLAQVQPGDLLFYDLDGAGIDHVVMYVGSGLYGAETIIQAAHTGTVVEFDPFWSYGLVGAGRP